MESLVARNKLVRKGQARHEPPFLEPENGTEASGKEDSLDDAKGDAPLGETGHVRVAPLECPLRLLLHARNGIDRVQETHLLAVVLDIGVDQQGVGLGVDVLDGDLESVETSSLRRLKLSHEILGQILVDDSVGGGKEGKDVADEVALVVGELRPIGHVRAEIDFFRGPERGFGLFVHFPQVVVSDGENHKPVGILNQEWFRCEFTVFLSQFVVSFCDCRIGGGWRRSNGVRFRDARVFVRCQ
mmetsp:Transcript_6944/g.16721  ORF Transcript_6944/g.16721 Transcript_6944/m.16721 type:complete len:243 (-) Transcript_6944:176-904(-)